MVYLATLRLSGNGTSEIETVLLMPKIMTFDKFEKIKLLALISL